MKMLLDPKDLTRDKQFWQTEAEIQKKATGYITKLKKLNLYDIHGISPQTYEVKMANNLADQKKKSQKSTKKTEEKKKK